MADEQVILRTMSNLTALEYDDGSHVLRVSAAGSAAGGRQTTLRTLYNVRAIQHDDGSHTPIVAIDGGGGGWGGAGSARPIPRVAWDGDSRIDQGVTQSSIKVSLLTQGIQYWSLFFSDWRFIFPLSYDYTYDFATGGHTTTQMLAGIDQVLASDADIVVVLCGTNDRGSGTPLSTTLSNYAEYQSRILSAGKRLIWIAEMPRGSTGTPSAALTGNNLQTHLACRNWLLSQATVPGVHVLDVWPMLVDVKSTSGYIQTQYAGDGLHENARGAIVIGRALANLMKSLAPKRTLVTMSAADVYTEGYNDAGNLLTNGLFTATTALTGANRSGVVPTGMTLASYNSTIAGALVTDSDGLEWYELDITNAAASAQTIAVLTYPVTTSVIKAGNSGYMALELALAAGHSGIYATACYLDLTYTDATTFQYDVGSNNLINNGASYALPPDELRGTIYTPFTAAKDVKSFTVRLFVYAATGAAASAKVRVRALTVRKTA